MVVDEVMGHYHFGFPNFSVGSLATRVTATATTTATVKRCGKQSTFSLSRFFFFFFFFFFFKSHRGTRMLEVFKKRNKS